LIIILNPPSAIEDDKSVEAISAVEAEQRAKEREDGEAVGEARLRTAMSQAQDLDEEIAAGDAENVTRSVMTRSVMTRSVMTVQ
jgi:hypothetical protein